MPDIPKPHFEGLDTAFLQLSFAMKLWNYVQDHDISPELDIALTIQEDNGSVYVTNHGEFGEGLEAAAGNNIGICFGAAAITLWEAIREHTRLESRSLTPSESKAHMLAGLSFSIRCCFAHGTVEPRWKLDAKYRIEYRLGNRTVDLRAADCSVFEYSQLGGVDGLRILHSEAKAAGLL